MRKENNWLSQLKNFIRDESCLFVASIREFNVEIFHCYTCVSLGCVFHHQCSAGFLRTTHSTYS